jgi:hypothetical protein
LFALATWPGWLSPWLWTADTWAGVQCVVLVVGLIVAWTQVREAVRLREESTRPFVSIDLYVEDKIIYLAVENYGPTLARNVHFSFDPALRSQLVAEQIASLKMFSDKGIPTLPPHKVINTVFDVFPVREEAGGYEDSYRVQVSYDGSTRRRLGREHVRRYSDEVVLDLALYRDRLSVRRHTLHDLHDQLGQTNRELAKCASALSVLVQQQRGSA